MSLAPLPENLVPFLGPYLPKPSVNKCNDRPFVTLTYAQSLDSRISSGPGVRTAISHAETKTMTHYLRSKHAGILVGISTVLADDPGLNCRYSPAGTVSLIQPIIVDGHFRLKSVYSGLKMAKLVQEGLGLPPIVITIENDVKKTVEDVKKDAEFAGKYGMKLVPVPAGADGRMQWKDIFGALVGHVSSVMVEGGANVINSLLNEPELVDSLVVTVGPVYLGKNGVEVSPAIEARPHNVKWWTGKQDSVLAAQL